MIVDVPVIKVDKVEVEVEDLTAQVAVVAEVRRLAELSVGAVAHLDKVELEIDGVEAQALLECAPRHRALDRRSRRRDA